MRRPLTNLLFIAVFAIMLFPSGVAAAPYAFSNDLQKGMTSGEVSTLQGCLADAGYFLQQATGYFGPITFTAVQAWQGAHQIPSTGYFGPISRAAANLGALCADAPASTTPAVSGLFPPLSTGPSYLTVNGKSYVKTANGYVLVQSGAPSKRSASAPALISPTFGLFAAILRDYADSLTFNFAPPSSNSQGAFTFSIANPDFGSVSGTTITIPHYVHGTTTITATQAAAGKYLSAAATASFTVNGFCASHQDYCENGGTCVDGQSYTNGPYDSFTCSCPDGFAGRFCTYSNVRCNGSSESTFSCNNGTCEIDSSGGSCSCQHCWTGMYCDIYDENPEGCALL